MAQLVKPMSTTRTSPPSTKLVMLPDCLPGTVGAFTTSRLFSDKFVVTICLAWSRLTEIPLLGPLPAQQCLPRSSCWQDTQLLRHVISFRHFGTFLDIGFFSADSILRDCANRVFASCRPHFLVACLGKVLERALFGSLQIHPPSQGDFYERVRINGACNKPVTTNSAH